MTATEQTSLTVGIPSAPDAGALSARWSMLRHVPLRLSVDIPLPPMSLRALGALQPGQLLSSTVATAEDLTVVVGGAPVCLARFEYTDGRMSIRATRLLGAPAAGTIPSPAPIPAVPAGATA